MPKIKMRALDRVPKEAKAVMGATAAIMSLISDMPEDDKASIALSVMASVISQTTCSKARLALCGVFSDVVDTLAESAVKNIIATKH